MSDVGFTNTIYDYDGIVRHYLWKLTGKNGKVYKSFAGIVYENYCDYYGIEDRFEPVLSQDGLQYIKYALLPGENYQYSAHDILSGNFDPEDMKGKIILVGARDSSISDGYVTAVDKGMVMFDVELQANVIYNCLNDRNLQEVPLSIQLSVLFVVTAAMIYIMLRTNIASAIACFILINILDFVDSGLLWNLGYSIHPLYIVVSTTFILLVGLAIRVRIVTMQRNTVNSIFNRYIDRRVFDEIMLKDDNGDITSGSFRTKKCDIAVMFADIRNFTSMTEKIGPEATSIILNSYLSIASKIIDKYDGTLDKYIGDCVMSFWGAPLENKDAIYLCCKAAIDIIKETDALSREVFDKYGESLSCGIGIAYGEAIVGDLGSEERVDYTAIGDTVNIASRLENLAEPNTIYISSSVKDGLREKARIRMFDKKLTIKGKAEPVEVFMLEELLN